MTYSITIISSFKQTTNNYKPLYLNVLSSEIIPTTFNCGIGTQLSYINRLYTSICISLSEAICMPIIKLP